MSGEPLQFSIDSTALLDNTITSPHKADAAAGCSAWRRHRSATTTTTTTLKLNELRRAVVHNVRTHMLPANYERSTIPSYLSYVRWSFVAATVSSASGVLSTQALLFGLGLNATTGIAAAAAMNWVLKDGIGMLGGMLFASVVNTRFDANPKRFRLGAAAALDSAMFLEVATPLFPAYFLPLGTFDIV
jgi:hypothetical protein